MRSNKKQMLKTTHSPKIPAENAQNDQRTLKRVTCYHLQFAPLFNNNRIWLDIESRGPRCWQRIWNPFAMNV